MKTSNIRAILAESMKKAANGELEYEDGRNIIGLANQISHSMKTEVKVAAMKQSMGHKADSFGNLSVDGSK